MRILVTMLALMAVSSEASANTQRILEQIGPWVLVENTDSMSGKSDLAALTRTAGAELSVWCLTPRDPITTIATVTYLGEGVRRVQFRVDDRPAREVSGTYGANDVMTSCPETGCELRFDPGGRIAQAVLHGQHLLVRLQTYRYTSVDVDFPVDRAAQAFAKIGCKMDEDLARAKYTLEVVDGVICLEDLDAGKSVTSDAENVIQDLFGQAKLHPADMAVIYRDTLGRWDEILVKNHGFAGFRSIGVTNRADAISSVLARLKRPSP